LIKGPSSSLNEVRPLLFWKFQRSLQESGHLVHVMDQCFCDLSGPHPGAILFFYNKPGF
jgi:hypothetical protein